MLSLDRYLSSGLNYTGLTLKNKPSLIRKIYIFLSRKIHFPFSAYRIRYGMFAFFPLNRKRSDHSIKFPNL